MNRFIFASFVCVFLICACETAPNIIRSSRFESFRDIYNVTFRGLHKTFLKDLELILANEELQRLYPHRKVEHDQVVTFLQQPEVVAVVARNAIQIPIKKLGADLRDQYKFLIDIQQLLADLGLQNEQRNQEHGYFNGLQNEFSALPLFQPLKTGFVGDGKIPISDVFFRIYGIRSLRVYRRYLENYAQIFANEDLQQFYEDRLGTLRDAAAAVEQLDDEGVTGMDSTNSAIKQVGPNLCDHRKYVADLRKMLTGMRFGLEERFQHRAELKKLADVLRKIQEAKKVETPNKTQSPIKDFVTGLVQGF